MRRFAPWLVPAVLAAVVAPSVRGDGGDSLLFVAAGRTLLSSHWREAFANSSVQAGPLQLALFGSVGRSLAVLSVVVGGGVVVLVVAAARSAGVTSSRLLGLTGIAAVVTGLTVNAFEAGHPADAVLPLVWVLAAADARRGRVVRAGVLVGLGAGLETWSVLGLAVLVLAPRGRDAVRGAAAGACAAAALFLPFVVGGRFEMLSYTWNVSSGSLLSVVVAPGTHVGWALRIAQGAAALAAGFGVARLARRSVHAVWLVPLAVVLARLALDPLDNGYYFVGVVGPALVGLAAYVSAAPSARLRRWSSPSSPSLPAPH
ncbi:MAG TPA: hypothetical protein VHQ89_11590 [Gaiellaceae bacterium]|nr:hypothetical protein [Gaiellaceae bacterium]